MSTTERLQAMEALWDSLLHDQSEIESPDGIAMFSKNEKSKIKTGKAEFISIEKLRQVANHEIKNVVTMKEVADDLNDGKAFMTKEKRALVITFGIV